MDWIHWNIIDNEYVVMWILETLQSVMDGIITRLTVRGTIFNSDYMSYKLLWVVYTLTVTHVI